MKYYILGASTSGKTSIANRLGNLLHIDIINLDDFYWKEKYTLAYNKKDIASNINKLLESKTDWIIEGVFYNNWIRPMLNKADLIFFIETPPLHTIIARAMKRKKERKIKQIDDTETTFSVLKMSLWTYSKRKKYECVLRDYKHKVIYLNYKDTLF